MHDTTRVSVYCVRSDRQQVRENEGGKEGEARQLFARKSRFLILMIYIRVEYEE